MMSLLKLDSVFFTYFFKVKLFNVILMLMLILIVNLNVNVNLN